MPADALWNNARSALDTRDYSRARELFNEFIKRNFNDPRVSEAHVHIGSCEYSRENISRALEAWNRIVNMEIMQQRSSPALLLGLEQLSKHYRSRQNTVEQEKMIDHLVKMFPDDPVTTREVSVFARESLKKGNWREATDMFSMIEENLSAKDRDNLLLAREMSRTDGNVSVLIKAANTKLEESSIPLAIRFYEEALKRNPSDDKRYEAMTKMGWCLYLEKELKQAEKLWQEVISSAPQGNEWRGKSRWHMIQLNAGYLSDREQAIKLCAEQAKEFQSGFLGMQSVFTRAWLLKITGEWEEAKKGFEHLLRDYPETADCPPVYRYIEECDEGLAKNQ